MPNSAFFRHLGLFALDGFFDIELCEEIRSRMRAAQPSKATVVVGDKEGVLDEDSRKVLCVKVDKPVSHLVRSKLLDLIPRLDEHFHVQLADFQGPDFLRYGEGAYYKPHRDRHDNAPPSILKRRVSAIVFLNSQRKTPAEDAKGDGYGGGSLAFYGLLDGSDWEKCGFSLEPEQGLLIAFRSEVLHEVQAVTFGERYTVVGWFTAD